MFDGKKYAAEFRRRGVPVQNFDTIEAGLEKVLDCIDKLDNEIVELQNKVAKLHEAVAFLRVCSRSGENGADHAIVLEALER